MTTFFVKSGGSDAAAGTSDATAWATIAAGPEATFGSRITAGDTILFRQGDTFSGQLYNSLKNNVTVGSYDPATSLPGTGRAVISNTGGTAIGNGGASGVTIKDLDVTNGQPGTVAGFTAIANDAGAVCTNFVISNCLIHGCGNNGIIINNSGSTGWTIQNCQVYTTGDSGIILNGCGGGHTIQNCVIHDTGGIGAGPGYHGVYAHAASYTIKNNEFYNNPNGQSISLRNLGTGSSGSACGNYIHDTPNGIAFFSNGDTATGLLRAFKNQLSNVGAGGGYGIYVGDGSTTNFDTVIASNTVVLNAAADVGISTQDILHASTTVANNIVSGGVNAYYGHNVSLDAGKTFTEDYNFFFNQSSATPFKWSGTAYNFANYKTNSSQSTHSSTSDPKLSTAYPYIPQFGSPVIDAGTAVVTGMVYSLSGSPDVLYVGAAPDIGAMEALQEPRPVQQFDPIPFMSNRRL